MDTSLIVLGSAQDGGSPQFASRAPAPTRTASSLAVSMGERWLLLDASPDLRSQWAHAAATGMLPYGPPDAVAVSHAHMGHYGGLMHFGTEAAASARIDLIAPRSVIRHLRRNEPWASLLRENRIIPRTTERSAYRWGIVDLVGLPIPHRGEFSTTVAYSIHLHGEPWALYLPDIDTWEAWPEAEGTIEAHDIAFIDATFGSADEIPDRDISAIPHPLVTDTIDRFRHLTATTAIHLTHLNHTNPLGVEGSELRRTAEGAGFRVARDGLVIVP